MIRYYSPEQINNQELTVATDVWFIGIFLYEVFFKFTPFSNTDSEKAFLKGFSEELKFDPEVKTSTELRLFIAKCL